jgi:hypothetical protein
LRPESENVVRPKQSCEQSSERVHKRGIVAPFAGVGRITKPVAVKETLDETDIPKTVDIWRSNQARNQVEAAKRT